MLPSSGTKYVSMMCERMSALPQAVWRLPTLYVSVGSRNETFGCSRPGMEKPIFSCVASFEITPPASMSEPVAEIVEMSRIGSAFVGSYLCSMMSQASPS